MWSLTDLVPSWGDGGERPPENTQYDGGDTLNEKYLDYLWSSLRTLQEEMQSALSDIDSDGDGVVDEADSTNAYSGNDIDSDGDGTVDTADTTTTVKGNDIDSDGDGTVDTADNTPNVTGTYKGNDIDSDGDGVVDDTDQYDGTAPSDGTNGQVLQTDGTTTSFSDLPADWSGDGTLLSPDGSEIGIDVERVQNADYKEDHVLSETWGDLSTATLNQSINTQDSSPSGIAWNDDGTKLYEVGFDSDNIYEYDVSTAYDISTASFSQSINTQDSIPRGIAWNDDGTKLYEVGVNSTSIYEYDVSTAYDISTASFSQSANTQDAIPSGLAWNDDGTKLYEIGSNSNNIYESDVSTPYDISTASFSQSINTQDNFPKGVVWSGDGAKLYEVGISSDNIYEYNVSTPYDISTATFFRSISTQDGDSTGIAWNDDGMKLYEVGGTDDSIYELDLPSSTCSLDLSSSNVQKAILTEDTDFSFIGVNESAGNSCTLRLVQEDTPDPNIETFEDGDADGWDSSTYPINAVQSTEDGADPFSGDWCGEVTDGETHHTLPFNSISPNSFGVAIRSEVDASYSNNDLIVSFRSGESDVMKVTHNRIQQESNISVNGQDTGVSGSYSTWFDVHFLDIDWSSETIGSVEIDGTEVLTDVSFQNSANSVDSVRMDVGGSGHTGYVDNIIIPSPLDSTDHTPTFSNVQWPDGETPSWSTAAGAIDVVGFSYDPDDGVWRGMPSGYNFARSTK